jgi:isoleucyl-tRNA synthetase
VLTHGFVCDAEGRAYSKSSVNYIPPERTITSSGAELFRLWSAAEDYRYDLRFSEDHIRRFGEAYRKMRNTFRFALGNLFDFDPSQDLLPDEDLEEIDRWALVQVGAFIRRVLRAYESFEFHTVFHATVDLCSVDLSARYFDILKDRLYCTRAAGRLRRSAQTAIYRIASALARLLAPVLCFTAEDVWDHLAKVPDAPSSVHLADLPTAEDFPVDEALAARWDQVWDVRDEVNRALEEARRAGAIGKSLEAAVTIRLPEGERAVALRHFSVEALADILIVSKAAVEIDEGETRIEVAPAGGEKCPRCWKQVEGLGSVGFCHRCEAEVEAR